MEEIGRHGTVTSWTLGWAYYLRVNRLCASALGCASLVCPCVHVCAIVRLPTPRFAIQYLREVVGSVMGNGSVGHAVRQAVQ